MNFLKKKIANESSYYLMLKFRIVLKQMHSYKDDLFLKKPSFQAFYDTFFGFISFGESSKKKLGLKKF